MSKNKFVPITILINLIITSLYSFPLAINDYHSTSFQYETWSQFWPLALPGATAFLSIIALFKIRWAKLIAIAIAICFYGLLMYSIIDVAFDPLEQKRNGGILPAVVLGSILVLLNILALIVLAKTTAANQD